MKEDNRWNRPAPIATMEKPGPAGEPLPPEEVAAETHRQLEERGWCPWDCSELGSETVIVAIDETVQVPAGYPVYTVQELEEAIDLDGRQLQTVHELKKLAGARIRGVVEVK